MSAKLKELGAVVEKARAKWQEWEARTKELETRYREQEDTEICEVTRTYRLAPDDLAKLLSMIKITCRKQPRSKRHSTIQEQKRRTTDMKNKIITAMLAATLAFGSFAAPAYAYVENDVNAEETTETAEDESADAESDTAESASEDTDADTGDSDDSTEEDNNSSALTPDGNLTLVDEEDLLALMDEEYITDNDDADADDYLDDGYEEDEGDGSEEEPVCPYRH